MSQPDVFVSFGADTKGVEDGVSKVKDQFTGLSERAKATSGAMEGLSDSVSSFASSAGSSLGQVSGAFQQVGDSAAGLNAVLTGFFSGAVLTGLVKGIESSVRSMSDLQHAADVTGASLHELQDIQFAANAAGGMGMAEAAVNATKFMTALHDATMQSDKLSKFLADNNIHIKNADGSLKSMSVLFEDINRAVYNAATGFEKIKILEAVGLTEKWLSLLNQSPEAFRRATGEAHNLGLIIDDEVVHAAVKFQEEWDKSTAEWGSFFKKRILDVSGLLKGLGGIASEAMGAFTSSARSALDLAANPALHKSIGDFGRIGTKDEQVGEWGQARKFFGGQDAKNPENPWDDAPPAATPELSINRGRKTNTKSLYDKGGGGATDNSEAFATARAEVEAARDAAKDKEQSLDSELKLKHITMSDWLSSTKETLQQELAATKAAYDKELQTAGLTSAEKITIKHQEAHAIAYIQRQIREAESKSAEKAAADWKSFSDKISGEFTGQVSGLLRGTTNFGTAFKNIMAGLATSAIESFVKIAAQWALTHSGMQSIFTAFQGFVTGATLTGETARTVAVAAGATAQTTAVVTGAATGAAAKKAINATEITGDAARAGAGAYASVVGIPIIGPILAPVAAAVAFGAVEAFGGGFAQGSWEVPGTGPALLHQGEMIVPAGQTPWAQSLMANAAAASGVGGSPGGGGPSGGDIHNHFHGAVMDWSSIAKGIAKHMSSNPSTRLAY
jgi:hypothetical protein